MTAEGRFAVESKFPGDVVIVKGVWQKGKTIGDVVDSLKEGDVIVKGANALDLDRKQAAILIGHPKAGTIGLALPADCGAQSKTHNTRGSGETGKRRFVRVGGKT